MSLHRPDNRWTTRAHVLPRFTSRFAVHHTSRPSFDFMGPRRFDVGGTLGRRLVEAGQQLGGDVGPFFNGQRQCFSKKFLRSRGHLAILDRAAQPNKALHLGIAVGTLALRIDHHGSTSIPGLGAKPIIDIQVSVAALQPLAAYGERLQAI